MAPEGIETAFIGFGEAAMAFAADMHVGNGKARAYDIKTDAQASRDAKLADYHRFGVTGAGSGPEAIAGSQLILSLVTADQALAAARQLCGHLSPGALFCDMNSVAPETKRAAATLIEQAGGRYVDVAVMAPAHPSRLAVPLLLCGPHAEAAEDMLRATGFTNIATVPGPVGAASGVKMIRSVIVKGIEALSAECFLAAHAAGVSDAVIASLDASWPGADWRRRADYNLDRMFVHGLRRAAEMEEVVKTLDALGVGSTMSRGTLERQRAIGALRVSAPDGLAAKAALLLDRKRQAA